jgi:hypothetical protein
MSDPHFRKAVMAEMRLHSEGFTRREPTAKKIKHTPLPQIWVSSTFVFPVTFSDCSCSAVRIKGKPPLVTSRT